MPFVLDNSVVSGWLLENHATDYSEAIARRLGKERAVAPPLLRLEYINVLRTACRRQRMIAQQAQQAIDQIASLPIDLDDEQPEPGLLLSLALRYDLSSHDAAYLELSLRRKLPIATQDAELAAAARAAGVGTVSA
jgi:predicted nucleic acid-binding protein